MNCSLGVARQSPELALAEIGADIGVFKMFLVFFVVHAACRARIGAGVTECSIHCARGARQANAMAEGGVQERSAVKSELLAAAEAAAGAAEAAEAAEEPAAELAAAGKPAAPEPAAATESAEPTAEPAEPALASEPAEPAADAALLACEAADAALGAESAALLAGLARLGARRAAGGRCTCEG